MIPYLVVFASAKAEAMPVAAGHVEMRTALLFVILVMMAFSLKMVSEMRQRLVALEDKLSDPTIEGGWADDAADHIPPEIVAAITAAVVCAEGGKTQIVSMAPVMPEKLAWSLEGRRQVFQSHRVR